MNKINSVEHIISEWKEWLYYICMHNNSATQEQNYCGFVQLSCYFGTFAFVIPVNL